MHYNHCSIFDLLSWILNSEFFKDKKIDFNFILFYFIISYFIVYFGSTKFWCTCFILFYRRVLKGIYLSWYDIVVVLDIIKFTDSCNYSFFHFLFSSFIFTMTVTSPFIFLLFTLFYPIFLFFFALKTSV